MPKLHGPWFSFEISAKYTAGSLEVEALWVKSMARDLRRVRLQAVTGTATARPWIPLDRGRKSVSPWLLRGVDKEMWLALLLPDMFESQSPWVAGAVAGEFVSLVANVLDILFQVYSSRCGTHRDWWAGSCFGRVHRPPSLAWVGAVATLTWAEKDRPLNREGTPSLRWPNSSRERSAPDWICLGAGRVELQSSRCCGLGFAWNRAETRGLIHRAESSRRLR